MGCASSKLEDNNGAVVVKDDSQGHGPQQATVKVDKEAVDCLIKCEIFKDFSHDDLEKLSGFLQREEYAENKVITMEGEAGDRMHFVSDGVIAVTAKDNRGFHAELRRFVRGDVFSEVSLFFENHKHGTTCSTLSRSVLYSLHQDKLKQFTKSLPRLAKALERRANAREMMTKTIENIPVLKSMTKQKRYILLELCAMRLYHKNENIVEQGIKSAKRFFIVASGNLNVYVKNKMVRQLTTMDYFGDVSLVSDKPHSATVQVADREEAIILELRKDDFISLMAGEEGVLAEFGIRVAGVQSPLEDVLHHPLGRKYLTNYVTKEFAKENIDFWVAVDALEGIQRSIIRKKVLRSIGVSPESVVSRKNRALETMAEEIYSNFLAPDAKFEINVSSRISEAIRDKMEAKEYSFNMFAEARQEIVDLLKADSFPRFLQSEDFHALLKEIGAYELNEPILQTTLPRKKKDSA